MINKISFYIASLMLVFQILCAPQAMASISGPHSVAWNMSGCLPDLIGGMNSGAETHLYLVPNGCTVDSSGYVPRTGYYKVRTRVVIDPAYYFPSTYTSDSSSVMIDASKSIHEQQLRVSTQSLEVTLLQDVSWRWCQYLVDDAGKEYSLFDTCGSGGLNPTPPVPKTSCTINGGNALSVPLGILDRSELPTVADAGNAKSLPITVSCTGSDVTVNMKLKYSSMSLGSSQAVKTSANGVGVAILYEGQPLSTSDTTPITFLEGSNSMNLSFEAVRDSAVELKDIPTGAFTASAILEMTQQ